MNSQIMNSASLGSMVASSHRDLHPKGRAKRLPPSVHNAFVSLKVGNLKTHVINNGLPLISKKAEFIYGVVESSKRLQVELEGKRKQELQNRQDTLERRKLAQQLLKKQKYDRVSFLTLKIDRNALREYISVPDLAASTHSHQIDCANQELLLQSTHTNTGLLGHNSDTVCDLFPNPDQTATLVPPSQSCQPEFPLTPPDTNDSPQLSIAHFDEVSKERLLLEVSTMSDQPAQDLGGIDDKIKDVIQDLYEFQQHIHGFRPEQQAGMLTKVDHIGSSLKNLYTVSQDPSNPIQEIKVAPDIIDYVDAGRNPDIYTREFVELVQRGNSVMKGKQKAFRDFSKIFAKALKDNFNGMDDEVDTIMRHAGMEEQNGESSTIQQNGHSD